MKFVNGKYEVTFNMKTEGDFDEVVIIPVSTIVHTSAQYWSDKTKEEKEEKLKEWAEDSLEEVGVSINMKILDSVVIKELAS